MPIKDDSQEINSAGKKHPVPQNVMDVEFKVVGDLTLRQILYIAVGGGLAWFFWKSGLPPIWQWSLAGFFFILGLAVAFVPLQERSLDKWIAIFVKAMLTPTQMVWVKSYSPPSYFLSDYASIIKNEIITLTPVKSRTKLEQYLDNIGEDDDPLDIIKSSKIKTLSVQYDPSDTLNSYTTTVDVPETPSLVIPMIEESKVPESHENTKFDEESTKIVQLKEEEETQSRQISSQNIVLPSKSISTTNDNKIPSFEEINEDEIKSKNELIEALAVIEGGYNQEGPIEVVNTSEYNRPINLTQENSQNQGEINIKGLRKLPPIIVAEDIKDIKEQEETLEKKASELLEIAKKVRKKYKVENPRAEIQPINEPDQVKTAKDRFTELKSQKDKLSIELSKSNEQIRLLQKDSKNTTSLEKQVELLAARNKELEDLLKEIHQELYQVKKEQSEGFKVDQEFSKGIKNIPSSNNDQNDSSKQHQNPNLLNIIQGTVKDQKGQLVEGVVVLIKDSEGNVLRALKTNQLGQFTIQSPINNGKYIIEALKGGLKFDILSIEAKGTILSPLYFIAK